MASRKLAGAIAAMLSASGLLLGLAALDSQILVESKELLFVTLGGIFGLGGWQIAKQAQQDAVTPPRFDSKTNGG